MPQTNDQEQPRMQIDQYHLDREWRDHPQQFYNWAMAAARAEAAYEQAKTSLDIVWAEVDADVRSSPDDYGIQKVTEVAIDAAIKTHGGYTTAKKRMLEAKNKMNEAEVVVKALEHRRKALDALTQLYVRDYYSEDGPRPAATEAREDWEKRAVRNRGRERMAALPGDGGDD